MQSSMILPRYVQRAIDAITHAGKEAYVVGGCVRDALRGVTPHDYDLTTSATPAEMQRIFADFHTIETGIKHGTLTVMIEHNPLEITTYRIDGSYADGRHPDAVQFTDDLTADLARRDFTVNAMAYHPIHGLVDPFHGAEDLAAGVLRAVGVPEARFTEDGLRILRALRFAATLGFTIEPQTAAALHTTAPLLKNIAAERICTELSKLLCGKTAGAHLHAFSDTVSVFLPQIAAFSAQKAEMLDAAPATLPLRLAMLLVLIEDTADIRRRLRELRFDNDTIRTIERVCNAVQIPIEADRRTLCRLLRTLSPEEATLLCDLQVALGTLTADDGKLVRACLQETLESGACYKISMLALGGEDLRGLGVPPGRGMGALLEAMLDAVIDGKLDNTPEALTAFVLTNK